MMTIQRMVSGCVLYLIFIAISSRTLILKAFNEFSTEIIEILPLSFKRRSIEKWNLED